MKFDTFFKWIWNLNGLVLFFGIIIFTVIITYEFSSVFFKNDVIEQPTLNLTEDNQNKEKWSLGYPEYIRGTDFYYISLESEQLIIETKNRNIEYFSDSSYTPTRSKNVIFINSITNESNWLFDSIEQLIIEITPLMRGEFGLHSVEGLARGISYEVINNDTNLDGKLSSTDKRTFAISNIDGTNYTEVITGYNRIVKYDLNSEGNLFVVFINNNEVNSMLIDMTTFKVLDKKLLPKVGDA